MKLNRVVIFLFVVFCAVSANLSVAFAGKITAKSPARKKTVALPDDLSQIKEDLTANDLEIVYIKRIKKNLFRLTLKRGNRMFRAKWKLIGINGNESSKKRTGNNSPRCETAAYWFNEAVWGDKNTSQHIVPLVVVRAFHINLPVCGKVCRKIPAFNKVYQFGNFPKFNKHLVFGALSYWLEGVTNLNNFTTGKKPYFFDRQRFENSPDYRRSFSDINLFAYLVQHGDANFSRNFLITKPDYQRIFAVDNGYTFDGHKFYHKNSWYGFRRYDADDLTVNTFSRQTAKKLSALNLDNLRRRLRMTALVNLDTGETVLVPPEELTDIPLSENPLFKRRFKGVYTGRWRNNNWAAWCIEEPGINEFLNRIEKTNKMLGTKFSLFP